MVLVMPKKRGCNSDEKFPTLWSWWDEWMFRRSC